MKRFIRYVLFRLKSVRVGIDRDADEAALVALLYMSVSPGAVFVTVDMLIARSFAVEPLFNIVGRWPYGLSVLAAYFLHYAKLHSRGKSKRMYAEFRDSRRSARGTLAVALY